jgi:hypothetical protein
MTTFVLGINRDEDFLGYRPESNVYDRRLVMSLDFVRGAPATERTAICVKRRYYSCTLFIHIHIRCGCYEKYVARCCGDHDPIS